jgi:hypothetical protein
MTGQSGVLWDWKMDGVMKLVCVRVGCEMVGVGLRFKNKPAAYIDAAYFGAAYAPREIDP